MLRKLELYPPQARGPAQAAIVSQLPGAFLLKILGTAGSVGSREETHSPSQLPWRDSSQQVWRQITLDSTSNLRK